MRCNTLGELCTAITGATQRPYTLGTADVGHTLRTYVFATNIAGTTLARTAPTAVVQASATGSVALHLPRAGAAQLTITVRASKGSAAFTRITLAPPKGTSFNVPNSLLSRLVRVLDGSGHRVSFTLVRKGSGLVITLRKSERSVKLIVGVRVASANLARHHRASWGIRFKETFRGLTQF
jgi:hypothetical protein